MLPETFGERSCVFFGLLSPQDLDAKQQARAEVVAKELKDFEQRMTPQERAFPTCLVGNLELNLHLPLASWVWG